MQCPVCGKELTLTQVECVACGERMYVCSHLVDGEVQLWHDHRCDPKRIASIEARRSHEWWNAGTLAGGRSVGERIAEGVRLLFSDESFPSHVDTLQPLRLF